MPVDELTIVLPAFDEVERLPAALDRALAWRDGRGAPRRVDVLVVDDGSRDGTRELVRDRFGGRVRLLARARRGGKGAAVRSGVMAAETRWLCFADADASIPFEDLDRLTQRAAHAPIVIGSKRAPGSDVRRPVSRRLLGALGQALIALAVVRGFRDTQCGFKLFRTDVARELFAAGRIDGFGFDVEILFLARRLGHPVVEVPIRCEHRIGGTVRASAYLQVLAEIARITWYRWSGAYPERRAPAAPRADPAAPAEPR